MSDLSDMISEARRNNHTDDQIIQFLLEKDPDLAPMIRSAMDQKHSSKKIADFLMTYEPTPPPEPVNPRLRAEDISNVGPAASEASRDALARTWAKTDAARGVKPDLGVMGNVKEFGSALWNAPGQLLEFAKHPFRSIAQGVDESVARSREAFRKGDYSTGIGYALAAPLTPIGGGVAAQAGEELGAGRYGAGAAHAGMTLAPYQRTVRDTAAALTPDVVTRMQFQSPVTAGPPRMPLLSDFIKRYGPDAANVHPKLMEAMGYATARQLSRLTKSPNWRSPITIQPKQPPAAPPAAAGRTPVRPPVRPSQPPPFNPRTGTLATGSTLQPLPAPLPATTAAPPPMTPPPPPGVPPPPAAPPAAAPPGAAPPAAGPVPTGALAPFDSFVTFPASKRPGPAAPMARTFEPPFPARQPGLPEPPAAMPGITPDMVEIANQMLEADQAPPGGTVPPGGTPPTSGADAPSSTGAASGAGGGSRGGPGGLDWRAELAGNEKAQRLYLNKTWHALFKDMELRDSPAGTKAPSAQAAVDAVHPGRRWMELSPDEMEALIFRVMDEGGIPAPNPMLNPPEGLQASPKKGQ